MFFNARCISTTWDRFTVVRRRGGGDGDDDPFLLALRMSRLNVYGFFLVLFPSRTSSYPLFSPQSSFLRVHVFVCMSVRDPKIPRQKKNIL